MSGGVESGEEKKKVASGPRCSPPPQRTPALLPLESRFGQTEVLVGKVGLGEPMDPVSASRDSVPIKMGSPEPDAPWGTVEGSEGAPD